MNSEKPRLGSDLSQASGGYELVLAGALFALAGVWLDRKVGTTPLFIIVLSLLGFVGAGLNIYYRYRNDIAKLEAEAAAAREAGYRARSEAPADAHPDTNAEGPE